MLKKILKGGLIGFGAYLGYALVAGNILPQMKKPTPKEDLDIRPSSSFYGEDKRQGPDKAAFFEDQDLLLPLHLDLLNSAEKTIKFANFSIKDGKASDLFYGKLLEAADRGVEVNVLFDGKGHDLFGIRNGKYWALMAHPNIKLAFYEPFRWKRPWTWQNRMHDKYLIIDDRYVLTGGVNLEDAFFFEDHEEAVYDRDVVIHNQNPERYDESVLKQYSDYFESVWYHPFTAVRPNYILKRYKKMAEETHEFLLSNLKEAEHTYEERASTAIDWDKHLYPTGKVSLVTNPIQRWKKDPVILSTLGNLYDEAKEKIVFQSPYVVPSKDMLNYISLENTEADIIFVTNSLTTSTNFFAMAGQRKYLDKLSALTAQIYHFQGKGYIHAKTHLIDERLCLVGSFNFDPRSSFLSQENLVVIDSPELATAIEKRIKEIARSSVPYKKDGIAFVEETAEEAPIPWYKKVTLRIIYLIFYPLEDLL